MGAQQNYSAYLFLSVGIISIFCDFKCDTKEEKKDKNYVEPFPVGTQKVAYVRDDISSSQILEKEKFDSGENITTNTDKCDIIYINTETQLDYQEEKIAVNPYDLPEDF
jgi:hypothetical protein